MTSVKEDRHAVRSAHEVEHGQRLAAEDPEAAWGWNTPAGQLRARRRANLIMDGARLRPGIRVLEIGCGTGNFTRVFAESGADIIAVDISPDLLEGARKRNLPTDRIRFECRRFEDCRSDGPFDAVVGSSILHHLEIQPALHQIRELLKPGGVMSFAEPNMLNPQVFMERKLRFMRRVFWYVSPDETAFVRWRLHNQLQTCGFECIKLTPFDWLHPKTPPMAIPIVQTCGRFVEWLPLAREFAGSLHILAARPRRHDRSASAARVDPTTLEE